MAGTLGGLIKDFRIQKNLSQLEVALALGWKEGSILSRIEQSIVEKPAKEVIEKISIILELSPREKNDLLLAGNYLPDTEEIEDIRSEIDGLMNSWKYPSTAYDFSWRIIHENNICKKIYYESDAEAEKVRKETPNVFELNFDKDYSQNKYADKNLKQGIDTELIQSLKQYRSDQKSHNGDENINSLIKKLVLNKNFRTLWEKAQNIDHEKVIDNYNFADYIIPARGKKETLSFHLFNAPMLNDPRINIEFHVPSDKKTFEYFEAEEFSI